jgi:hypothetical protein
VASPLSGHPHHRRRARSRRGRGGCAHVRLKPDLQGLQDAPSCRRSGPAAVRTIQPGPCVPCRRRP